jgi:hypothetical protein
MVLSKGKWWIAIVVVVLVAVAIGAYRFYKSRFFDSTLPDSVYAASDGLYQISYDTIIVDEVGGSVIINNIVVAADTASLRGDTSLQDQPAVVLNLKADTLRVFGVKTPRALLNKEISGSILRIKNASVEMYRVHEKEDTATERSGRDIIESVYWDVLRQLKMVDIDTIMLENIDLTYTDLKTNKLILRTSKISLVLHQLLIDSNSLADRSRIFFAKRVEMSADSIQLRDAKGEYDFRFQGLSINTGAQHLKLRSASIEPRLGEKAFMNQQKYQRDRFDISLSEISIKSIDPERLSIGELVADSLSVGKSNFKIFRDLRIPRDKESRVGQYPHQVIMKVPFPLDIRKAFFNNSFLEYKEINDKTGEAGKVQFNRVTAVMQNLTNDQAAITKNNLLTIDFDAWFLNTAKIDARMSLRIGDKQGRFSVSGNLGKFNPVVLNQLTIPMGKVRVDKGVINGISFKMTGDNYNADGELTMLYEDLKVSSLKQEDGKPGYQKKGLESVLANAILRNKNPSNGNTRRSGMKNERNTNRSFFNLVWKSIFAGVKESVGMDILGKSDGGNDDRQQTSKADKDTKKSDERTKKDDNKGQKKKP